MKYYYLLMSTLYTILALTVAIFNPSAHELAYRVLVPMLEVNLAVFNYLTYRNVCEKESRT